MFRPHAKPGNIFARCLNAGVLNAGRQQTELTILFAARHQVHLRAANEFRDKLVLRVAVKLTRASCLHDNTLIQHNNPVGKCHRFGLVMRDIDRGDAELVMQPRDLEAHIHPQRRIQIRQRLVEEKSPGFTDDGTADGHTLTLSAGQLFRQPVQQRL